MPTCPKENSAPARVIPAPARRGSAWSRTSVLRSRSIASRKKPVCAHRSPVAPAASENRPRRRPGSPGGPRSAAEVDRASSDRRGFVGDHADRHEVLERAGHRVQHARKVAARGRRLRHRQERPVFRLPRPPTVLHRRFGLAGLTLPSRNRPPGPRRSRGSGGRFDLIELVEAVGIEPTSEDRQPEAATPIVRALALAGRRSRGRDHGQTSLFDLAPRCPGTLATPACRIMTPGPLPCWRGRGGRHR